MKQSGDTEACIWATQNACCSLSGLVTRCISIWCVICLGFRVPKTNERQGGEMNARSSDNRSSSCTYMIIWTAQKFDEECRYIIIYRGVGVQIEWWMVYSRLVWLGFSWYSLLPSSFFPFPGKKREKEEEEKSHVARLSWRGRLPRHVPSTRLTAALSLFWFLISLYLLFLPINFLFFSPLFCIFFLFIFRSY
mgnify:CR=1 FL=1